MRTYENDGRYTASHIPGPSHNFLALRLSPGAPRLACQITVLPAAHPSLRFVALTAKDVEAAILEGIQLGCEESGLQVFATSVEILADDTNRPEVYVAMARRIVLHHAGLQQDQTKGQSE